MMRARPYWWPGMGLLTAEEERMATVARCQRAARLAWRNYEIMARGDGDTLLEVLFESTRKAALARSTDPAEIPRILEKLRLETAAVHARLAAQLYREARVLAGIEHVEPREPT